MLFYISWYVQITTVAHYFYSHCRVVCAMYYKALQVYFRSYIGKKSLVFFCFFSRHLFWFSFSFDLSLISILISVIKTWKIINHTPKVSYINFNISIYSLDVTEVHAVILCTLTSMSCHVCSTVLLLVKTKSFFFQFSLQGQPSLKKMKLSAIGLYIITNNKHAKFRTCILLSDYCW